MKKVWSSGLFFMVLLTGCIELGEPFYDNNPYRDGRSRRLEEYRSGEWQEIEWNDADPDDKTVFSVTNGSDAFNKHFYVVNDCQLNLDFDVAYRVNGGGTARVALYKSLEKSKIHTTSTADYEEVFCVEDTAPAYPDVTVTASKAGIYTLEEDYSYWVEIFYNGAITLGIDIDASIELEEE
jgi:hypothetical protein